MSDNPTLPGRNGGADGSTVKREAGRSGMLAESWRGAAVVECDAGDGTVALLPLLVLAERRRRAKGSMQNGKGVGTQLGLKAGARAGAIGRHPPEGVVGVRPRGGEALLPVGHGRGARWSRRHGGRPGRLRPWAEKRGGGPLSKENIFSKFNSKFLLTVPNSIF
jgi:hypothetical protein